MQATPSDDKATQRSAMLALFQAHLADDASAVAFCVMVCEVAHVWDDLVDRDKAVSDARINEAFRRALVLIPSNSFFRQHAAELLPLLDTAILSWRTATTMERQGDEEQRRIAYVVRSDYLNLFLRAVAIVRGFEYAAQAAVDIRMAWHREGWDGYCAALETETLKRMTQHGTLQ